MWPESTFFTFFKPIEFQKCPKINSAQVESAKVVEYEISDFVPISKYLHLGSLTIPTPVCIQTLLVKQSQISDFK